MRDEVKKPVAAPRRAARGEPRCGALVIVVLAGLGYYFFAAPQEFGATRAARPRTGEGPGAGARRRR